MNWFHALTYLQRIEENGAGFWHRNSDNSITVFVRGEHGNDPNQWRNARQIEDLFGVHISEGITPDKMSGHLVLKLRPFKVYKCEGGNLTPAENMLCDEADCQACCQHDERDHGICLDCGHEEDPGAAIDVAMDAFEDR